MTDIVDRSTRSRMMAGIRGKDTKPEMILRSELHQKGFRFRLHVKELPGKPDMVLKKHRAVIFAHGCFWHVHDCHLFKWPATRPDFWRNKLNRNKQNDHETVEQLLQAGWRVCIVWECCLKGKGHNITNVIRQISDWLYGEQQQLEISQ